MRSNLLRDTAPLRKPIRSSTPFSPPSLSLPLPPSLPTFPSLSLSHSLNHFRSHSDRSLHRIPKDISLFLLFLLLLLPSFSSFREELLGRYRSFLPGNKQQSRVGSPGGGGGEGALVLPVPGGGGHGEEMRPELVPGIFHEQPNLYERTPGKKRLVSNAPIFSNAPTFSTPGSSLAAYGAALAATAGMRRLERRHDV